MSNFKDLGLSYEEALHGVQSAIKYKIENGVSDAATPKHLRVGVDMSKADMLGLVELLISKGVFSLEEYVEHMRLAANTELHLHETECRHFFGFENLSFR